MESNDRNKIATMFNIEFACSSLLFWQRAEPVYFNTLALLHHRLFYTKRFQLKSLTPRINARLLNIEWKNTTNLDVALYNLHLLPPPAPQKKKKNTTTKISSKLSFDRVSRFINLKAMVWHKFDRNKMDLILENVLQIQSHCLLYSNAFAIDTSTLT